MIRGVVNLGVGRPASRPPDSSPFAFAQGRNDNKLVRRLRRSSTVANCPRRGNMHNRKSLSLQIAGATALTMLFGTSAFAESRHHSETSRGSGGHIDRSSGSRSSGSSVQRDRSSARSQSQTRSVDRGSWHGNDTQRNTTRDFSQRDNTQRNTTRDFSQRDNAQRSTPRDTQRNDWRGNNTQRNDSRGNNSQRNDSRYNNNQRSAATDRFRHVEGWRPGGRAPYANHERVSSFGRV